MRLKLDENLPAEVAGDLRDRGHDVETVAEEGLAGRADRLVVAAARRERRILITLDKGIRGRPGTASRERRPPIVLIRLRRVGAKAVRAASIRAVEELAVRETFAMAVVTDAAIRVRR
jgi:predicted nuclease of predicted toxin-antitoxin system